MLSHVMIGTNDIERSQRFYDAVLGVLGAGPATRNVNATGQTRLLLPPRRQHVLRQRADRRRTGQHRQWRYHWLQVQLARAVAAVSMTYAVAQGGTSIEDPPGATGQHAGAMQLAYVRDPDGHKLCALHRPK